ncbi:MAG: 50S ribosomal protein L20 [Mycoplasmataceae bacterium]|jgi:large subunit ribosomal protein L20|nr:50S ribosomal protein L20 [Mycoplasmataceae bacterium]
MRSTNGPKTLKRRKAVKERVSGAWGTKHTSYKIARQTMIRQAVYAFRDRKAKKGEFRRMWNNRINGIVRSLGYTYSKFINALKLQNIEINRKMLSELAINEKQKFINLVNEVMKNEKTA